MSRILDLRVSLICSCGSFGNDSEPSLNVLLSRRKSSSCRHCFPDFSRAELEWLNHFRSRGRHSVDWRGVPFVQRGKAAGRSESLLLDCRLCSIVRATATCECAFHVTSSTCRWKSICCGKEALMRLRRWSFSFFFFVGFLTRRSLHRRNRHIRCVYEDALFHPFFCRVPNRRQPMCSKRISPQWNEFMCESSDREAIEFGGAGEGTKGQCYVAVSHLIQLWQSRSDIVVVFSLLFFRAVEHHGVQPESLCFHSKLTWLLIPCCYLQAQPWAIFLHRGVYSSLGWVILKRESWAEQESCSVSKATKLSAERECPSNAGLDS